MTPETDDPNKPIADTSLVSRIFVSVEHTFYIITGVLLAATAALALLSSAFSFWTASLALGAPEEIIILIDRLLFVLMLLEIFHTVRVSIRDGVLVPDPFLVVGLIASIRRVLAITLASSQATHPGNWTPEVQAQFTASMIELGVLSALIFVLILAIFMLRRGRSGAPGSSS